MKTLIICKSIHHQNTMKVGTAIAEELHADIVTPETVDFESAKGYDLIGFGSGIYMGKHHRSLLAMVDDLDGLNQKKVFIFYTSGFEKFPVMKPFDAALTKRLTVKGATIVGTFSCRGWETYGPFKIGGGKNKGQPNEDDIAAARAFAVSL